MSVAQWDEFVEQARIELMDKNNAYIDRYRFSRSTHYDWNLERAEIIWSEQGVPIARADIQYLGSFFRSEGTWLWSWANETIPEVAKSRMQEVRSFGQQLGFQKLVEPEFEAIERDGENMTAIAAKILGADGFHREKFPDLSMFFVLINMQALGGGTNE